MPLVNIDTVGQVGVIKDVPDYVMDPAAWNEALNVRAVDGRIESIGGRSVVFPVPSEGPRFLMPVQTGVETYWMWASLRRIFMYDSLEHRDITRTDGLYTARTAQDWNGLVFNGVPILNNGNDVPQYWPGGAPTVNMKDLPNWPSNFRAKVLRSLGGNLVAINITSEGENRPHRVRWSHTADPGTFPSSWAIDDPEVDAGENDLADVSAGPLLDAGNLRGQMFLYKAGSTWRMRYVGGQYVFSFDSYLETSGILATRCWGQIPDGFRHFVVTQDDIMVHDGASAPTSILEGRLRRHIFASIDPVSYVTAFVFPNAQYQEMWFCYPEVGNAFPNMALVWNYKTGAATFVQVNFQAAATGAIAQSNLTKWNEVAGAWSTHSEPWATVENNKTIVANPTSGRFYQMDSGNLFEGELIPTVLRRTNLALVGRRRNDAPMVDFHRRKMVTRVYPRIRGTSIDVRIGAREQQDGSIRWTDIQTFTPASQRWLDLIIEGGAIAIEFTSADNHSWILEGYDLDLDVDGEF